VDQIGELHQEIRRLKEQNKSLVSLCQEYEKNVQVCDERNTEFKLQLDR